MGMINIELVRSIQVGRAIIVPGKYRAYESKFGVDLPTPFGRLVRLDPDDFVVLEPETPHQDLLPT